MNKTLLGSMLVAVALSSGCTTSPPVSKMILQIPVDIVTTARLIDAQAKKCWQRKPGILTDGIRIRTNMWVKDRAIVSAERWNHDMPKQTDFLRVEMSSIAQNLTEVQVLEGEFDCGLTGNCRELGYAKAVERWIDGDLECKPTSR